MDLELLLKNKNLSPMMRQYVETKLQNKNTILFYRLGDFYEMFFDDAILVSNLLEIALTGKDCGLEERAPMCGIPYHAIDNFLPKLIEKGYKVAIAEQVEDPKLTKGIVKREITKIVTPGTFDANNINNNSQNNYIFSLYYDLNQYGLSIVDFINGDFFITSFNDVDTLIDLINKLKPKEILYNKYIIMANIDLESIANNYNILLTNLDDNYFDKSHLNDNSYLYNLIKNTDNYDVVKDSTSINAAIAVYLYLKNTQKIELSNFVKIKYYSLNDYMYLDSFTIKNLELFETIRDKDKIGSLFFVINKTKTAMGARLLKNYLLRPLSNIDKINYRLNAIKELKDNYVDILELNENLKEIYDLDRLLTRMMLKTINPRDLLSFKNSIKVLPEIKKILSKFENKFYKDVLSELVDISDIYDTIEKAIMDEPGIGVKDGNIIKNGYNKNIDELRDIKLNGKQKLTELEENEKQKYNIKNLKIKYSRVFGYLFEITNGYKGEIPSHFIRKQTLTNAERYTTKELDDLQYQILNADNKLNSLEYELFNEIIQYILDNIHKIKSIANAISKIDAINSLALVSIKNNYVCPEINNNGIINIKNGRHPVIESLNTKISFIPNDTYLDNENYIDIITGPNMAGKSTYMRQVAIITLLAHIGSFVPAEYANISLVDKIFTRVGASDDLVRGQSTFLVEMNEVANILDNATNNSLIILDEIGRGTSTYDGLSIAWAIVEYISNIIKAKTLFATHYHELSELEGKVNGVTNYNIAVIEQNNDIKFLRKIVKGSAKKSYGIAVAKLAGVNNKVLNRANNILSNLVKSDLLNNKNEIFDNDYFDVDNNLEDNDNINNKEIINKYKQLIDIIKNIDITNLTPVNALVMLSDIKGTVDEIKD